MTNVPPGTNYAKAFGIDSVAGAVIFAILYPPLLFFFIARAISRPTFVYIVIALFCAVRVGAFVLRALLASVATDAQDLNVLLTYEVLYSTGFFGLLNSAYTLVLDRGRLSDLPLPDGPISRITRRPHLFRIALVAAVAVGITGAIQSATGSTQSTINTGNTLRQVAIYTSLVLCIFVAFQTILLVGAISSHGAYKMSNTGIGATFGIHILCIISLLLLVREAFFAATVNNPVRQNDENWWFPFAVLTEFVAVVLFTAPGLVPSRDELPS